MVHKDTKIFRARFHNLKLHAFGIAQTLLFDTTVEIYQAKCHPPLWRARPVLARGQHKWQASSAEELMRLVEQDFVEQLTAWEQFDSTWFTQRKPSLFIRQPEKRNEAV